MSDDQLKPLLGYLRDARGFDFTGYKPSSLERRLRRRMETVGIDSYEAYRDYLEVHPNEFAELFNTILINVTGFFRDPSSWDAIRERIIPAILEARPADAPIRVWCAGCASGEEAYTTAILFAEALGDEQFLARVKVYATDVDEDALEAARLSVYDAAALEDVPEDLRARYFERAGTRWTFRKELRRSMIFGRNNLLQDAPISRIDLLVCRNTLMYFNSETQAQILRRLHFALQPTGFLFLGKSEMLLTRRELFEPVDLKRRIFTKVVRPGDRRGGFALPAPPDEPPYGNGGGSIAMRTLEGTPNPVIVVGRDRSLLLTNDAARRILRVGTPDIGRPLQDLEVSYRPAELRGGLDAAFSERRVVVLGPATHRHDGADITFEIRVAPLPNGPDVDAVSVTFLDVTAQRRSEQEVERARRELGAAYEELQSTVEELETTNEELQSTNEELETTNEELQSTNEELETMNEELASSNEELETMNDELRLRSMELREANAVMEAIMRRKGVGAIVVDREERVRMWSSESEDLWGLREDEAAGVHLLDLDIGLPLEPVRAALRDTLRDGSVPTALTLDARDRRGREFRCAVSVVPLTTDGDRPTAAVVLAERA